MRQFAFAAILVVFFALGFGCQSLQRPDARVPPEAEPQARLLDGLGAYRFAITSDHPLAQRYFNQGLALAYGFNHDAAERSFLEAARLDPECAMCWWGAALVLGPHINAGMETANASKAWERLKNAQLQAPGASAREQAFIRALASRYVENPPPERKLLDMAYARAMAELARRRPDDLDAQALWAEALMNLHPWDFYDKQGRPKPWTAKIVAILEGVLARDPDHPGANHYYIHAVEASRTPDRALPAADRLLTLMPGAGHLVHMPAHIYMRTGQYHRASVANQRAIESDEDYLASCTPQGLYPLGYVPHNHHLLWASASMEGASRVALAAADATAQRMRPHLMRQPGFAAIQHYWVTPLYAKVRFGRWDALLQEPAPPADLAYPTAVWHYALGMAHTRRGNFLAAQAHLEALARLAADPEMETLTIGDLNSFAQVLKVAERALAGELAAARGEDKAAVRALREAVAFEDQLNYDEPPPWHYPVRQSLGAVLLASGQPARAEAAYREDLRWNRDNGWSLFGLAKSLRAQGRRKAAMQAEQDFRKAWSHADLVLSDSRF